jgi:hypothetical protein
MSITKNQWSEIIAETRRSINASAAKHNLKEKFQYSVGSAGDYSVLSTAHLDDWSHIRKAVAYQAATGELKAAKLLFNEGEITGVQVKPAPKAWRALAGKPAAEIVTQLRLTNFVLVTGAHAVAPPSGERLYLVQGFRRQADGRVSMIVKEESGHDAHQIAERIAGPDYLFNSSMNIGVDVPPELRGVLFQSDEELYAKVPALRPRTLSRKRA